MSAKPDTQSPAKPSTGSGPSSATHVGRPRPPAPTIDEFIASIKENRLVRTNILEALRPNERIRENVTTQEFAETLIESGHLTRWQAERLLTGRTAFGLGRYTLIDRIGAGGMGVVLKARQPGDQPIVAIKVLSQTLLRRPEAVRRFDREVKAASALDHNNIVRALDSDCINGIPFLVMEYVEGRDLHWLVRQRGPLPVAWACEFGRQAALGLQHANERGLVHRDIKPDNLLLTRRSPTEPLTVKILDFGLARFTSETPEATGITSADQIFGSVDFIAPEQAQSAKLADIRSDIFSLGATLYFVMTAATPFRGETVMEKLTSRITDEVVPLRNLHPDVPAGLEQVIMRMMAHNPEDRYQTPAEVAKALEPYAAGTSPTPVTAILSRDRDEEIPELAPSEMALEKFLGELADQKNETSGHSDLPESRSSQRRRTQWPPWPDKPLSWRRKAALIFAFAALTILAILFGLLSGQ